MSDVTVTGRIPPPQERNAKCACGSGRKFKKCCYISTHEIDRQRRAGERDRIRRQREAAQTHAEHDGTIKREGEYVGTPRALALALMVSAVSR